jgi:hypothetical protein
MMEIESDVECVDSAGNILVFADVAVSQLVIVVDGDRRVGGEVVEVNGMLALVKPLVGKNAF